jgi:hypothetical protein
MRSTASASRAPSGNSAGGGIGASQSQRRLLHHTPENRTATLVLTQAIATITAEHRGAKLWVILGEFNTVATHSAAEPPIVLAPDPALML